MGFNYGSRGSTLGQLPCSQIQSMPTYSKAGNIFKRAKSQHHCLYVYYFRYFFHLKYACMGHASAEFIQRLTQYISGLTCEVKLKLVERSWAP